MRYVKFIVGLVAVGSLLVACGGGGSGGSVGFVGGFESALNGEYRFIEYGASVSGGGVNIFDLTFEGDGTGTYQGVTNTSDTGPFTYKLAENGEFRLYPDPLNNPTFFVKGQTDGSLLLTYDNDDSDGSIHISAGVGKIDTTVTTLSELDLQGDFRFVEAGGDGTTATTAVIDVNFDGSGTATITSYEDSDGNITPPAPVPYTVAANGELTIDGTMIGQVNYSGSVVVFADDDPGTDGFMSGTIGFKENQNDLDGDYTAGQFAVDNPQPPPTTSIYTYTSEILMTADTTTHSITGTWADSDGTSGAIPTPAIYSVDPANGNLTLPTGDIGQVRNGAFIAADIDPTTDPADPEETPSIMIMFGINKVDTVLK